MSEHDIAAASEAGVRSRSTGGKPSLFDRLRALFGLGGASIRDDIEEALADTSTEVDVSPQERALLKNVLALHEVHRRRRHGPARRHRRRCARTASSPTSSRSFATPVIRACRCTAIPSTIRAAWCTSAILSPISPSRRTPPERRARRNRCHRPRRPMPKRRYQLLFRGLGGLDIPLSQANILRPVLFVPPSMPALDLL